MGAQQGLEIEVAGVVDQHRVAGLDRKRQNRSIACVPESVSRIWSGEASMPCSAKRRDQQLAQGRRPSRAWP